MQPYVFPYIGYFSLIDAVDRFVFYDDVNYIKNGWVNRNQILVNQKPLYFTIPLQDQSSFSKINEIKIHSRKWIEKTLKTIEQTYKKAPYYNNVFPFIQKTFLYDTELISEMAKESILNTCQYLSIKTSFISTSAVYENQTLKAQERVIDICKKEGATIYINAIGGMELYDHKTFSKNGISLYFMKQRPIFYNQFKYKEFIPWLSIIDVMMHNDPKEIADFFHEYDLI